MRGFFFSGRFPQHFTLSFGSLMSSTPREKAESSEEESDEDSEDSKEEEEPMLPTSNLEISVDVKSLNASLVIVVLCSLCCSLCCSSLCCSSLCSLCCFFVFFVLFFVLFFFVLFFVFFFFCSFGCKFGVYQVCFLCNGYFRSAHTIMECLHTFCKVCLYNYFEQQLSLSPPPFFLNKSKIFSIYLFFSSCFKSLSL